MPDSGAVSDRARPFLCAFAVQSFLTAKCAKNSAKDAKKAELDYYLMPYTPSFSPGSGR